MDNKLRETAVTVAVWASSQYAVAEVWFAGPRTQSAGPSRDMLDVIIVMASHAQQVEARKEGRQVSTLSWEADIGRAVRGTYGIKMLNAGASVDDAQAVRIYARWPDAVADIVCKPSRSDAVSTTSKTYNADALGEFVNARPL